MLLYLDSQKTKHDLYNHVGPSEVSQSRHGAHLNKQPNHVEIESKIEDIINCSILRAAYPEEPSLLRDDSKAEFAEAAR